jgi:hypothetical protein
LARRISEDSMEFFVATELDEFRKQPDVVAVLDRDHSLLASNEFFRVYTLKKPKR